MFAVFVASGLLDVNELLDTLRTLSLDGKGQEREEDEGEEREAAGDGGCDLTEEIRKMKVRVLEDYEICRPWIQVKESRVVRETATRLLREILSSKNFYPGWDSGLPTDP